MPSTNYDANAVRTTEEGMIRAGGYFSDTSSLFGGYLQNVGNSWATMKATYGGNSANAFDGGVTAWEQQFSVVINALNEMTQLMGQTVNAYRSHEDDATSHATAFNSALPDFKI
jgi:WXG100 family type VII secretion target